ncbi:hypothetical protein V8G54_003192 [Vigna mungo]|uniref:Uncharacterized protein n=1 Tax=Vigna mungo TaxID=3915 RepID=A0AAQ3SCQ3_VIGMU
MAENRKLHPIPFKSLWSTSSRELLSRGNRLKQITSSLLFFQSHPSTGPCSPTKLDGVISQPFCLDLQPCNRKLLLNVGAKLTPKRGSMTPKLRLHFTGRLKNMLSEVIF